MADRQPRLRFWHSRKKVLKGAELGFDALAALARTAPEPQSVSQIASALGLRKNSVDSAILSNVLVALYKVDAVEADGKVSVIRIAGDLTKVTITDYGRELMRQSRDRMDFAQKLLERS